MFIALKILSDVWIVVGYACAWATLVDYASCFWNAGHNKAMGIFSNSEKVLIRLFWGLVCIFLIHLVINVSYHSYFGTELSKLSLF